MEQDSIYIRLTFRSDASNEEYDDDFACLFTKLDQLCAECASFESYRVLTDEDDNPCQPQ